MLYCSMDLGKIIKSKGLTQKYIAENLDVSQNTITNWTKEPGKMSLRHAVKLSELLHIELGELLSKLGLL